MRSLALGLLMMMQHDVAQAADYDYADNGLNWATDTNKACKNGKRQSPIDLKSDIDAKVEENFFKHYENVDTKSETAAVLAEGYGKTNFKPGAEAFYLTLDVEGLGGTPSVMPKSATWMATPNYFSSSCAADYEGDDTYYAK